MRPLTLSIEGLTAFRQAQSIDFSELDLFVVTGPTGAGKTSILDALTFALYGDVCRVKSGQLRDLVSHGATQVKVSLEFRVDGSCYRITRRLRKTGGGHEANLVRIDGDAEVPEVDSLAVKPVNHRIQEILGLDFDAFTKAVLLPQGAFHEFLQGDASARRKILISLLDLRRYERAGAEARQQGRLLAERLDERRNLIASEYADATAARLKERKAEHKQARDKYDRLQSAQVQAKKKVRAVTDAAHASAALEEFASDLRSVEEELIGLGKGLRPLLEFGETLATTLDAVKSKVTRATKAVNAKQHVLTKTIARVGDEAVIAHLEGTAATWLDEQSNLTALMIELQSATTELENADASDRKAVADVVTAKALLGKAITNSVAAAKAFERSCAILECAQAVAEEAAAKTQFEAEQLNRNAADAKATDAAEHLRHLEHANLASALRGSLKSGDKCPVCAATIEKLPKSDRNVASLLEQARRAAAGAETKRKQREQACMTAEAAHKLAVTKLNAARAALPTRAKVPPLDEAEAAFNDARAAAEGANEELEKASSAAGEAENAVTKAKGDLETAKTRRDGLERERTGVGKRLEKAKTALRKAFPGRIPDDFEQAIAERREQLQQGRTEVATAEQAARVARDERDDLMAQLREHEADLADFDTGLAEARTKTELAAAGLERAASTTSLPSLPQAKGERSAQLDAWSRCCRSYIEAVVRAAATEAKTSDRAIGELAQAIAPLGIEVVEGNIDDVLEAVEESCNDGHRTLVEAEGAVTTLATKIESRKQLEKAIEDDALLSRRYQAIGQELQQNNFIAFVLKESMERLSALATVELLRISDGRYSLVADDDGFDVVDHHNADECRSVATLSGGETFLASLALALALAGSVRDLAGAAAAGRLDAIFIDEGFGALDPETLEVVVDALERLREGERMVGVISHVPALAERIPDGLKVAKDGNSSRILAR